MKLRVSHIHECYEKTRQKYNGGISLLRSTCLLLLHLLLLSGRTHLLAEGHVGYLKTGNGADTDVEDREEEDADNTTHEDSCKTTSDRGSKEWKLRRQNVPGERNWYFSNKGKLAWGFETLLARETWELRSRFRSMCMFDG